MNENEELRLTLVHQASELDGSSMVEKVQAEQAEQAQIEQETAEQELAIPLTMLIAGAAAVLAPNWQITQEESGELAEVYAPVITKYFPDASRFTGGVEANAAMVTLGIVGARVMAGTPRKIEPAKDDSEPVAKSDTPSKATRDENWLSEDEINVKG